MSNSTARYDAKQVKGLAHGRWTDILSTVAGLPVGTLDGRHHPCPRCGGSDRFRFTDDDGDGSLICNQCARRSCGDGFASVQWALGCDFPTAVQRVGEYIGAPPAANGKPQRARKTAIDPAKDLQPLPWSDSLAGLWCSRKRPILPAAIAAAGGRLARYRHHHTVVDLPVIGRQGETTGHVIANVTGGTLPRFDANGKTIGQVKTKLTWGSQPGLIGRLPGDRIIVKTEGPTDALALLSATDLPSMVAVWANEAGAGQKPQPWILQAAAGKTVYVVGDADQPGETGAALWASAFAAHAAEVRHVRLPYPVTPDHGRDLRDWLAEGHGWADLAAIAAGAPVVSAGALKGQRDPSEHDHALVAISHARGTTEAMNARRLAVRFGANLRYCEPWNKWLTWDGTRWKIDDCRAADAMGKENARRLWDEFRDLTKQLDSEKDKTLIKAMSAFCKQSNSDHGIRAALALVRSEPGIPVLPTGLDQDPWLLNVENGTLDLRTCKLRPHDRKDGITKLAPVRYERDAACPLWQSFLAAVLPDPAIVEFIQRLAGYCLTGSTQEHVLPFLHGDGSNGKSTFLGMMLALLGPDYAIKAPTDLLLAKKNDAHPTELADLFGKRFVACDEAEDGRRLAESLVKELTGGDRIRARRMREDFWEFSATHKIWLGANHKPQVRGTDHGIWRRIKLVPFTVRIPDHEQDKTLPTKLLTELPGILNWALVGCQKWQQSGLGEPSAVKDATAGYRTEMDTLGEFITERCVVSDGLIEFASDLYHVYAGWAQARGEHPVSQTRFGAQLQQRGYPKDRDSRTGKTTRLGIRLQQGPPTIEIPRNTETTTSQERF